MIKEEATILANRLALLESSLQEDIPIDEPLTIESISKPNTEYNEDKSRKFNKKSYNEVKKKEAELSMISLEEGLIESDDEEILQLLAKRKVVSNSLSHSALTQSLSKPPLTHGEVSDENFHIRWKQ